MKWFRWTVFSLGSLLFYLLAVLAYGRTVLGIEIRWGGFVFLVLVGVGASGLVLRRLAERKLITEDHLKAACLASLSTLMPILALDAGYGLYRNSITGLFTGEKFDVEKRLSDPVPEFNSFFPAIYYPTERNFFIYRPNIAMSGESYGMMYFPTLQKFKNLANAILELRPVDYTIGKDGFRDTGILENARILALGDSFAFGATTVQHKAWVELLGRRIEAPVYNLGVNGFSPAQEVMLLEYLFQTKGTGFKPEHVLWMIFEANDLEDSYETQRRRANPAPAWSGTFLELAVLLPSKLREGSVIDRAITGRLAVAYHPQPATVGDTDAVMREVGDVSRQLKSRLPVYRSTRHGYKLFDPNYAKRVSMPESYVLHHPHRALLDHAFVSMKALSWKHNFRVTVVLAPSEARLYADSFEGFPPVSDRPHFLNYVNRLSQTQGFGVVDLSSLMQPHAKQSLFYWRDDIHWNEAGNEIVAKILARELFNK